MSHQFACVIYSYDFDYREQRFLNVSFTKFGTLPTLKSKIVLGGKRLKKQLKMFDNYLEADYINSADQLKGKVEEMEIAAN